MTFMQTACLARQWLWLLWFSWLLEIRRSALLKEKYGPKAENYIKLAEQIFEKWDTRGVWRETDNGGMVTVELPFGIDQKTGNWTGEYERGCAGSGLFAPRQ